MDAYKYLSTLEIAKNGIVNFVKSIKSEKNENLHSSSKIFCVARGIRSCDDGGKKVLWMSFPRFIGGLSKNRLGL